MSNKKYLWMFITARHSRESRLNKHLYNIGNEWHEESRNIDIIIRWGFAFVYKIIIIVWKQSILRNFLFNEFKPHSWRPYKQHPW